MTDEVTEIRQLTSEIEGWLSHTEGQLLYELAKNVPRQQAIIEIGSWKGKSTVWLAKGSKAGQQNTVYAIDPHQGSEAHMNEGETNTFPTHLANLRKAHVQDIVLPLITTSSKAAEHWQRSVGLLWIDGSHEYDEVKHDLLSWKQYLSSGGVVALHDCDKPGPLQVVAEYLSFSRQFTIQQTIDTIVVATKT